MHRFYSIFIASLLLIGCNSVPSETQLASMPGAGLSGLYAACLDGHTLIAGGCNFPDKPVTEGGIKVFYSTIYEVTETEATPIAELPSPSAYGTYVQVGDKLYIAGGANSEGRLDSMLEVSNGEAGPEVKALSPIPAAIEQGAGAYLDGKIYLTAGLSPDGPSTAIYCYDIESDSWETVGSIPEPFVQPVCTVTEKGLYIFGGYNPVEKVAKSYGYFVAWDGAAEKIDGPSESHTHVGSAYATIDGKLITSGGVNKDIFNYGFTVSGDELREYQSQPVEAYQFRQEILSFDPETRAWETVLTSPHLARAGAAITKTASGLVNAGGELKPGIRCQEIWRFDI